MIVAGLGMSGAAGYLYYKGKKDAQKINITKVIPQMIQKAFGDDNKPKIHAAAVPPNLDN